MVAEAQCNFQGGSVVLEIVQNYGSYVILIVKIKRPLRKDINIMEIPILGRLGDFGATWPGL
jgi:hypothetical protein